MKKVVTIFSNYLQPVFVKLMLRNTSATFFIISLCERVFLWKKPRTRKENVFWDCFWDKPTTFITSSTRVMKMKFCDYWENFCSGELRVNRVSQFGRTEFSRMIGPKQSFSCSFRIIWKKIMESKTFCLGELFTFYDDIKEKMKKYEEENFVNLWVRDSRTIEAARVKKKLSSNKVLWSKICL